jgi:GWxTD domain-containing protein
MSFFHFTMRVALLLFPLFCAEPFLAQEKPPHACFEQPNGAKEPIHRLPESARYWLVEDAVYIITPDERCAFLHLETNEEREQFIAQFWYRRTTDPSLPNGGFKTEHYRRIAFANEKYGGVISGWKTDRGRIYVLFGPPDSVDFAADRKAEGAAPNREADTELHPIEKWLYRYIEGAGEKVVFHFEFAGTGAYKDYRLAASDQSVFEQAALSPERFAMTPERIELYAGTERPPEIKFKDLEALLVSGMVRDQVKFSHQVKFAAATHATTLARIELRIPCGVCTDDGAVVATVAYPLFVRISKPSGRVVDALELTADMAARDPSDSGLNLTAHLDVPLAPGTYQLAIATKNATTGDAGVLRTQIDVPTYESLGTKN